MPYLIIIITAITGMFMAMAINFEPQIQAFSKKTNFTSIQFSVKSILQRSPDCVKRLFSVFNMFPK